MKRKIIDYKDNTPVIEKVDTGKALSGGKNRFSPNEMDKISIPKL